MRTFGPAGSTPAATLLADGNFTIHEAVEFSGLSRSALYNAMAAGSLPYVKLGRCRRIPKRALLMLLEGGLITAAG
jgi:excisionase family DNA binding protein